MTPAGGTSSDGARAVERAQGRDGRVDLGAVGIVVPRRRRADAAGARRLFRRAQLERQLPAIVLLVAGGARDALQLQRADLGQPRPQVHAQRRLLRRAGEAQHRVHRRQLGQRVERQRQQLPRFVAHAIGRREEPEAHGAIGEQLERVGAQRHFGALLEAARREAKDRL
jgi:predicted 2-oxoglutarate/Fe(II)-dependent dioxygenase YbiX